MVTLIDVGLMLLSALLNAGAAAAWALLGGAGVMLALGTAVQWRSRAER